MSKTVTMVGVLALAATTALAQSTTTTSGQSTTGQASGTSGQSSTDQDKDKGQHSGHGMTPSDSSKSASSSTGSLSAADRRFIETAARGGMAEVELGRLGTEKASSPEVKAFAQMMVDDHSKANDELKTLASQKGVTLPTDTDAKNKAVKDRLEKLSGDPFDKAFMQEMLKDHRKDVADFQKQAKSVKGDDEVKSWASKTLPTLEQHLQHARQASNMNTGGGTSATGTSATGTKSKDKNKGPSSSPSDRP